MNPFHDFERRIDRLMRDLLGGKSEPNQQREIVEIQRHVLDLITDRIQLLPRARRAFPYNDVVVRLPVPNPDQRPAYDAVFCIDDALHHDILEHLRREQAEYPADLRVRVSLLEAGDISVICAKTTPEKSAAPELRTARFTPLNAEPQDFHKARIHVGRYTEVLDDRRRLVRKNDLALDEPTVSRAHAHLEFDAATGDFRLFDDGSSYGTSVIHEGRLIDVPKAGARGFRLSAGDEIYFGQARVRFEVIE